MIRLSQNDVARFEASYEAGLPDECWEWQAGRWERQQYGRLNVQRKAQRAHRVAFFLFYGFIVDHLFVCHKCDNPPCVNPWHLFLGRDIDNIADRDRKGRTAQGDRHRTRLHPELTMGESNNHAKLTNAQAEEIRTLAKTMKNVEIARRYNVSESTVGRIVNGRRYLIAAREKVEND